MLLFVHFVFVQFKFDWKQNPKSDWFEVRTTYLIAAQRTPCFSNFRWNTNGQAISLADNQLIVWFSFTLANAHDALEFIQLRHSISHARHPIHVKCDFWLFYSFRDPPEFLLNYARKTSFNYSIWLKFFGVRFLNQRTDFYFPHTKSLWITLRLVILNLLSWKNRYKWCCIV